ncbi:hypothetical protein B296_00019207, partial [Ensete ventricosum]
CYRQQLLLVLLLLLFPLHILSPVSATADPSYPEATECGVREDEDLMVMRREEYDEGRILDITHAYHEDMTAGGTDEGLGRFLWLAKSMRNGSLANSSEMNFSVHSGTHVDAPDHLFQHYFDVDVLNGIVPLMILRCPALLADVPRDKNITADVMESLHIPRGVRRVLFWTLDTDR